MISTRKLAQLRAARSSGIGRLFLLARRDFTQRLAKKMQSKTGNTNPLVGGSILPFVDLDGTRSTELARRANISKQAVGKLLKELEEVGLVTRSQDESDGRAQIIFFTEAGIEYLQQIHASIKAIEQEYEAILGKEEVELLRSSLSKLAYADNANGK